MVFNFPYDCEKLQFLFILLQSSMQRTSERIRTHKKIDHSRKKSPSAIIKSSELMFLKPKPMHSYDSYMIGFHLAEDAIDNIL